MSDVSIIGWQQFSGVPAPRCTECSAFCLSESQTVTLAEPKEQDSSQIKPPLDGTLAWRHLVLTRGCFCNSVTQLSQLWSRSSPKQPQSALPPISRYSNTEIKKLLVKKAFQQNFLDYLAKEKPQQQLRFFPFRCVSNELLYLPKGLNNKIRKKSIM